MREYLARLILPESGFRIGRILGVPLQVHPTSVLFVLLILAASKGQFTAWMPKDTSHLALLALSLLGLVTVTLSLLAHEFGHVLVARRLGTPCKGITLTPFGMAAQLEEEPKDATEEALVTAAGPAVSIVLAFVGFGLLGVLPEGPPSLLARFLLYCNGFIAAFNLVPCYPLDGGRLVRAMAWHLTGNLSRATRIAGMIGMAGAGMLVAYGLVVILSGNPAGLVTIVMAVALVGFTAAEGRAREDGDAYLSVTASKLMLPLGPARDAEGIGMTLVPSTHRGLLSVQVAFWRDGACLFTAPAERFGTVAADAGPAAMLGAFQAREPGGYPLIVTEAGRPVGYLPEGRASVLGMPRRPPGGI